MIKLSELQKEGIGELLNIGMGNAAETLSQMVDEEILLSIPDLNLIPSSDIENKFSKAQVIMTAVSQEFYGAFKGNALLLFPEEKSLDLVWALLKGSVAKEDIPEMEEDALSEVGNVIINACLGTLSNMFKDSIQSDFPQFKRDKFSNLNEDICSQSSANLIMILMHVDIKFKTQNTDGYVAIVMDVGSLEKFLIEIDKFISGI